MIKLAPDIRNLIDILHQAHLDNCQQVYYARRRRRLKPVMPITSFVYEFFLYNSLYQVDWLTSLTDGAIVHHPRSSKEGHQQKAFERFLQTQVGTRTELLHKAFWPLREVSGLKEGWTEIVPSARIHEHQGGQFFQAVSWIQLQLAQLAAERDVSVEDFFQRVGLCRYFIYLVRNNIFHGSKQLGQVYEPDQKRRLELYDLFLKSLTSLFFLIFDRTPTASDYAQFSIPGSVLARSCGAQNVLDQVDVLEAVNGGFLKVADSCLIRRFVKAIPPQNAIVHDHTALFYPSAQHDLLTPILLGLPYCTEFYFYERERRYKPPKKLIQFLHKAHELNVPRNSRWEAIEDGYFFEFESGGIPRRVYWINRDNTDFLTRDAYLSFYFRRGDSWGEGGSGQQWDSKLLVDLLPKIRAGTECVFLTDGRPGGLHPLLRAQAHQLPVHVLDREGPYYAGLLLQ